MSDGNKGKEALIGRAVIDPDFRKQLLADPEGTIKAGGYTIDDETLELLKNFDPAAAEEAASDVNRAFAERRAAS